MIRNKICFILLTALLLNIFMQNYCYAGCPTRLLEKICDVCEKKALDTLKTDSIPATQEQANCPTASLACIQLDSFLPFLKSNYTITTMIGS